MESKYSLQKIMDEVINENINLEIHKEDGYDIMNSNRRWLRRSFDKLIMKLGCDKEVIKDSNNKLEFDELEMPIIKVLLSSFYNKESLISKFINKNSDGQRTSSEDVYKFLYELKKEIETDNKMDKENMEYLHQYLCNIFIYSPLRSIESCHKLIDSLALCIQDLTSDEQSIYLGKVEHILNKEVSLRIAESAQGIMEIVQRREYGEKYYYEKEPQIQFIYRERDRKVLEAIQEDDDLRYYIEKKIGKKAEEIFNYASLR